MTAENALVFDLADVRAVVVQCESCGGRISIPRDKTLTPMVLSECPFCNQQWLGPQIEGAARYLAILGSVQDTMKRLAERKPGFAVRLEFPAPPSV